MPRPQLAEIRLRSARRFRLDCKDGASPHPECGTGTPNGAEALQRVSDRTPRAGATHAVVATEGREEVRSRFGIRGVGQRASRW